MAGYLPRSHGNCASPAYTPPTAPLSETSGGHMHLGRMRPSGPTPPRLLRSTPKPSVSGLVSPAAASRRCISRAALLSPSPSDRSRISRTLKQTSVTRCEKERHVHSAPLTRATLALRTKGLLTAFRLLGMVERRWRKLDGPHLLRLVHAGGKCVDGIQRKLIAVQQRKKAA